MPPKLEKIPPNCLIIKYELDKEYLEKVAYTLTRKLFYYKGKEVVGYHYAPWNNPGVEKELNSVFGLKGRYNIKFIFLQPGTNLDWHTDKGTKSAVIWKMNGDEPLQFRDKQYFYHAAIVDTTKEHKVPGFAGERVLFKLSCFDMEYEELASNFATRFMNYEKN